MRARGAEVTDIVVLVVAADDGVMEQTREAINHARAAKVPIMVAVNKMDKEAANPDRVKRELAEQGLVSEDWGGDTTFSYVSAKTREGLDDLLDILALQAEILELKANPKRPAVGYIVEAKLDKGRGSLGTVLIQQGTLHLGDSFVCGVHSGRVRAMFNDQGKKVKEAGPSMPVEVQGFEGVPEAGEEFLVIADEKQARRIAEARALKQRERELAKESKITLETFLARKADSVEAEVLNLVVKADVRGSLEAITDALHKLSTEKVRINVIHGGTGAVSESDVLLSTASNAIIIGFNVRPTSKAKELAEQEKVDIRFYDIIYKLVEEIRSAMEGMLAPVEREVFLGTADVRETFSVPKAGIIAGCHVSDGKITRNARARLLRDGVVVYTGKIGSLRRFKDDVREVTKGYECGIGLENYNDIKIGDAIEAFEIVEEAATL
jgi:translation initiation factor IF-2